MNYETFGGDKITYLPESKSLFDNENVDVRFSDRFHGSVPVKTRKKIRELALMEYKMGSTKDDLKHEQRLDPYSRGLIAYLQHCILPINGQYAKRIISQEEHYCLIGDISFPLPRPHDVDNDSKLRLQLVILEHLSEIIISAKHEKFMGTGHASFLRCLLSIKRKYYIYDLANKLKSYINKCGLCLKLRTPNKKVNVPLQHAAARSNEIGDSVLLEAHNHHRSSKIYRKMKVLKWVPYWIHAIDGHHCVLNM